MTERHMLHAQALEFPDPRTGALRKFEAPVPADFEALLAWLRANRE